MIDEIFAQEMGGRLVFRDLSVLSPHYIPDELPHREEEAGEISKIVAPVLRGERSNNIFLYGKTGTGKTCVVKYVAKKLEEAAQKEQKIPVDSKIKVLYSNCKIHSSRYQVLIHVLEDEFFQNKELRDSPLEGRADSHLTGLTPGDLYERLVKVINSNNLHLIIVLDEIDVVKDLDDLVYALTRINDELKHGQLALIGISNKYGFKDKLDPRSKSTLCESELVFKPYNASQMKTILQQRVKLGFKEGAIRDSEVGLIAAIAAKTNGDARYGLRLLQKTGEIAKREEKTLVTEEHVRKARNKVEEDLISDVVSSLPEHQQIVLYSIAESLLSGINQKKLSGLDQETLSSGEVYEAYEQISRKLNRKPRTLRWFREYLNDLEMLGLITLTISGKGVRGNTTLIRLGYSPQDIKRIVIHGLGLEVGM
ncbi:Cdc6/Cdc18 family protein [Candidatus Altiarchaeota archaeon]